jgi:hypothetical protein
MFVEAFHSMIKGIHPTLEVNTSFTYSMAMMGFNTESST